MGTNQHLLRSIAAIIRQGGDTPSPPSNRLCGSRIPSSVHEPASSRSSIRSLAVSLPCACCTLIGVVVSVAGWMRSWSTEKSGWAAIEVRPRRIGVRLSRRGLRRAQRESQYKRSISAWFGRRTCATWGESRWQWSRLGPSDSDRAQKSIFVRQRQCARYTARRIHQHCP